MRSRFCDGLTRRNFLKVGALGLGGLALPQILRAEQAAGTRLGHKGIIMIYLSGGPPHLDLFDLKPEAPLEIRGEYRPIPTNVPGIEICEHMPRIAAMMDKFAVVRSLVGAVDQHLSDLCLSGWPEAGGKRQSGRPALGSVLSRLHGPVDRAVPPFVAFAANNEAFGNPGYPGFLGTGHSAFRPDKGGLDDMQLRIPVEQLSDRKTLLGSLDEFRRRSDERYNGAESFTQRALEVLTSSRLVQALNLEQEDPKVRERYGRGVAAADPAYAPYYMDQFLMARRLIEAGVRCVTVGFGLWDTHGNNFTDTPGIGTKYSMRALDQGITALVQDLHDRGLQDDISVVVWGEFGRTPRINKDGGRDHWPPVSFALLAGGGMRTGQVIGSTTRLAESVKDRPVHYQEVFATLYHRLGVDVNATTIVDQNGRPQYLVDRRDVVRELV